MSGGKGPSRFTFAAPPMAFPGRIPCSACRGHFPPYFVGSAGRCYGCFLDHTPRPRRVIPAAQAAALPAATDAELTALTPRQLDLFRLLAAGLNPAAARRRLNLKAPGFATLRGRTLAALADARRKLLVVTAGFDTVAQLDGVAFVPAPSQNATAAAAEEGHGIDDAATGAGRRDAIPARQSPG